MPSEPPPLVPVLSIVRNSVLVTLHSLTLDPQPTVSKVENLVVAGLAGMIVLTAYEIIRDALTGAPRPVRVDGWMLVVVIATLAVPLTFSRFELRAGQAANSPALIADACEYRVHMFTTEVVFASLVSERFGMPLDRVAALFIEWSS